MSRGAGHNTKAGKHRAEHRQLLQIKHRLGCGRAHILAPAREIGIRAGPSALSPAAQADGEVTEPHRGLGNVGGAIVEAGPRYWKNTRRPPKVQRNSTGCPCAAMRSAAAARSRPELGARECRRAGRKAPPGWPRAAAVRRCDGSTVEAQVPGRQANQIAPIIGAAKDHPRAALEHEGEASRDRSAVGDADAPREFRSPQIRLAGRDVVTG